MLCSSFLIFLVIPFRLSGRTSIGEVQCVVLQHFGTLLAKLGLWSFRDLNKSFCVIFFPQCRCLVSVGVFRRFLVFVFHVSL